MPPNDARTILACPPTNANQQLQKWGSAERYSPGIDYTLIQCERCATDMWMGPRQKAAYDAAPERFERLCAVCAVTALPHARVVRMSPVDSPRRHP